ncbi:hypothetical protein BGX29_001773 [Mortierella sp. GBA35]|nr:hypothetical protein BGX29_001773 [Mortierella sp. GBA35]
MVPGLTSALMRQDFIDLDPVTNTLKPWPCEFKLRHFSAQILGNPRPDVTFTHYNRSLEQTEVDRIQKAHPGQGRELQRQICERLARFKQLEILESGHEDCGRTTEEIFVEVGKEEYWAIEKFYQYDCLEMSLDSGLRMLGGLKKLKVLNSMRMATSIGVEEVRWMVESWPNLEEIIGLHVDMNDLKAENW